MPGPWARGRTCWGSWEAWPCPSVRATGRRCGAVLGGAAGESSIGTALQGRPLQMERSGWDHSMHVRAALGGPGTQPAARSAAQLRRIRAGAGKPAVTGALASLDIGQGGNILCVEERLDSEVTLRIYFYFSKSCLCLIHVENHEAVLLLLSMLHPQPVHSGLGVSETNAFS